MEQVASRAILLVLLFDPEETGTFSFKTLAGFQWTTWDYIPEGRTI
jgi:hypothetical protein